MENITVNMENLTEEERKTLVGLIEKANEKESFKPKKDELYYLLTANGWIDSTTWDGDSTDNDRYAIGNVFKTKEEAEFVIEKLKVLAELKRLAEKSGKVDWNDKNAYKYGVFYDHYAETLGVSELISSQYIGEYFATNQAALDAIQTIGADRIEKYLFGVEV